MQAVVIPPTIVDGKRRFTPIRYATFEVFAVTLSPDTSLILLQFRFCAL